MANAYNQGKLEHAQPSDKHGYTALYDFRPRRRILRSAPGNVGVRRIGRRLQRGDSL